MWAATAVMIVVMATGLMAVMLWAKITVMTLLGHEYCDGRAGGEGD